MSYWSKAFSGAGGKFLGDVGNNLTGVTQSRAIRDAAKIQTAAGDRAIDAATKLHDQSRADLMPWADRGRDASKMLMELFSPGGQLLKTYGGPYQAKPFEFDVNTDPGAQFRIDTANKGFERSAAGKGRSMGGGAIRSLAELNQALGSQEYGAAFDRFNTDRNYGLGEDSYNRTAFNQDQQNLFARLFGISGQGQASAAGQASQNGQLSDQLTSLFTGIGNSQAASKVGQANAKADALSGLLKLGTQAGVAAFI